MHSSDKVEFKLQKVGNMVRVVYVSNADVGRIIKPLGNKNKRAPNRAKINTDELADTFAEFSKIDIVSSPERSKNPTKEEDSSTRHFPGAAGSVELMNNDVNRSPIYSFKTPKKADQMAKYAVESAQKRKVQSANVDLNKEALKARTDASTPTRKTPKRRHCSRFSLRTRTNSDDDSSQSDVIDDSDAEEQNSSEESPSEVELYFDAHGRTSSRGETSDRTLQRLKNPRMRPEKVAQALEKHRRKTGAATDVQDVVDCRLKLCKSHEGFFSKWIFYLSNNYNVLLFGLGSKRDLIHSFCEQHLPSQDKLIINGFFPGLSMKSILTSITEDIMMLSPTLMNAESQIEEITKHFSKDSTDDLFLIVHNIDGPPLRNESAQDLLSRLSTLPKVHIVASVDHINAPLIWTQTVSCRFNWLWYDVTTYAPYDIETSFEGSLLLTGAGAGVSARGAALALSGLLHVAKSLTSNARGVFRILAERQIEEKESKEDEKAEDFSFFELYQKCRERFLVNSQLTLRAHLTEFVDHKLVHIRSGADGCDYLSVPLNVETLKEYLEQEETL